MAATKRSQNKCKKCGYTWYPRGKSISLKCPACGSGEVGYAGGGLGVVALVIVGVLAFGGDKKTETTTPTAVADVSSAPAPEMAPKVELDSKIAPVEQSSEPNASNVVPVPIEAGGDLVPAKPHEAECHGVDTANKDCLNAGCKGENADVASCQVQKAPKNELF